jgi:hypothetical protein
VAHAGGGNAMGGGLPGDRAAFPQETFCIQKYAKNPQNHYLNYWPAIGAPEHTDSLHSGAYPCATFTGSLDGPNQVLQDVSDSTWESIQFIVFDGPHGAYLLGGGLANSTNGLFVAKFNPSTGKQEWLTNLTNPPNPNQWIAFGSIGIIKDGSIIAVAGPQIFKLNRDTGTILVSNQLTVLGMPATDANFDGFHVAQDNTGAILMKTQTRPPGCPIQGNQAISECPTQYPQYGTPPNSTVVAVDPDTLQTIDAILLNQPITARPIVTRHNSQNYMYLAGSTTLVRVIWDSRKRKLTQDMSWAPDYLPPGQTTGDAPNLLGNWVIANTNANGSSTTPISVVAVNQDDPSLITRISPWGTTLPAGTVSESPASFGVDSNTDMIFAQDFLVGGVYGIKLNAKTGQMKVAWSRPDWRTSDYFSLIGPSDQNVLVSQYINPDFTYSDLDGNTYTESVLWADPTTGDTIAQSQYNPSTAQGSLPNVGYGGRLYMMGNAGSVYIYQVERAKKE